MSRYYHNGVGLHAWLVLCVRSDIRMGGRSLREVEFNSTPAKDTGIQVEELECSALQL